MPAEGIKKTVRSIHEALNKGDVDKAVSFLAENVVLMSPEGTFKGKNGIKRYFTWLMKSYTKLTFTETDLIVEGNRAAHVYVMKGATEKSIGSIPCMSMLEFKNGKVQNISSFSDRLSVAKQMARGVIQITAVNAIVNRMEKGLH